MANHNNSRRRRRREISSDSGTESSETDSKRRKQQLNRSEDEDSASGSSESSRISRSSDSKSEDRGRKKRATITEEEVLKYMAKRQQRKAMKVAKKLKGDSNLGEIFVWGKKIERDVVQGRPLCMSVESEKKRREERKAEIEKVNRRREERAIEKAQREEDIALLARERAKAEFEDCEKKEEKFHFDQSRIRSQIRLREGRMKPIDVLSNGLNDPYTVFKDISAGELEVLQDEIKMYLELDKATQTRVEFWEALLVVCDFEMGEARKRDAVERARVRGEEPLAEERGLHSSIEADVKGLLEGKTSSELESMQQQIESRMRLGTAKVVEYWEAVLKRLQIYKANARLKEIHADLLRTRLQRPVETEQVRTDVDDGPQLCPELRTEEQINDPEEEAGSFSPQLLSADEDEEAIDPEVDRAKLDWERYALAEHHRRSQGVIAVKDAQPDESELKAIEEGDAVYWWHDKYRPRKPKYFNRVHTGYEWNKYNRVHYDHENPPPKTVQGYKFNIFYPDLVDKSKSPTYTLHNDVNGETETCIIRFHSGPPYEDIAFKMVNKEWEYSHKGFKCTFERGILQLHFNFKRYPYRR